ncbi:MAG: hypothetical protein WAS27_02715 [Candidatus Saccharimonadales bacterium]
MIEINLLPDVKQELLKAKQMRFYVMSGALVVGALSIAVVVLMALYLVTVQGIRSKIADDEIAHKSRELLKTPDLSNMLTIQQQLASLSDTHTSKYMSSRVFDMLAAVNPPEPNQISISSAKMDTASQTITIEGQAVNGFEAAETFKKTVLATTATYKQQNTTTTSRLTDAVATADMSYGEDATGKKVLRFTMSFVYGEDFFQSSATDVIISGPSTKNVTDSYLHIPQSLFSQRASQGEEG